MAEFFNFSTISDTTRRRLELAASVVVTILVLYAMWKLVYVLVPYALSAGIAFLIMPLVDSLANRLPGHDTNPMRAKAIAAGIASVVVLTLAVVLLAVLVFRVVEGTPALAEQVPGLVDEIRTTLAEVEAAYRERVPQSIQDAIDPRIEEAGAALVSSATDGVLQAFGVLRSGLSLAIALAGSPIILFYLLYDAPSIGRGTRKLLPSPLRHDLSRIGGIGGSVVLTYLRTQLLMAVFVAVVIGLPLWALGVPAAALLGIAAGLGELIPVVGPLAAFVLAAIVVAFTDLRLLPVVAVLYGAVQLIQNTLVTPRVQGRATGLHPLGVMLSLAVLGSLWGFWGVLIAVPSAAAAYRIQAYVRQEWNAPGSWSDDDEGDEAASSAETTGIEEPVEA